MLGYLDALIAALSVRDVTEAERLMAHPLARLLPEDVRAEAAAFTAAERDPLAAPLRALLLRHQTAELLRDHSLLADQPDEAVEPRLPAMAPPAMERRAMERRARHQQMELPLPA